MQRRTVSTINDYLEPKEIFETITQKHFPYSRYEPNYKKRLCRDRCLMSCGLVTAGRITAITGGPRFEIMNICNCGGIVKRVRDETKDIVWVCQDCKKSFGIHKPDSMGTLVVAGKHEGLQKKNFREDENFITIFDMEVVKRKKDTLEKYGKGIAKRDPIRLPLKRGLYKEEFVYRDQLVPFAWLIKEYLDCYMADAEPEDRMFPFSRVWAWNIINKVTDMYPNWFRSQSEHFHGHYLIKDSVLLSKFVKVVNPFQVGHYIGYSDSDQLKDSNMSMNFDWIDSAVKKIKRRVHKHSIV